MKAGDAPPAGLLSAPGTGQGGLTVADAAGSTRVTLGMIGTVDAPSYGLRVVSSDGTTVIIDGSSNMFKIIASGTQTQAFPAAGNASTNSVTLTALGAGYSLPPACLWSAAYDNSGTNIRTSGLVIVSALGAGTISWRAYTYLSLSAGQVVANLVAESNLLNPGTTAACRYYILQEAGI
jgi:hypothetical protein